MHPLVLDRSELPHCRTLQIAQARCVLRTNYEALIHLLAQWTPATDENQLCDFTVNVQVDGVAGPTEPAFFRGMGHLVLARYGTNVLLLDIDRKRVHAWLSRSVANNAELWNRRFIPLILGVLGCAIGVLPLHSACVVKNGRGILIAGESMCGKSTLSVALAQQGFALVSDDWTYVRTHEQKLIAHGLHAPVKLLPDAVNHFPELKRVVTSRTSNGEIAYEVSAQETLGATIANSCAPEMILFLQRESNGASELIPASSSDVKAYVSNSVDRLPRELHAVAEHRQQLVNALSALPAWQFRYSGSPQKGARSLAKFLELSKEVIPQ